MATRQSETTARLDDGGPSAEWDGPADRERAVARAFASLRAVVADRLDVAVDTHGELLAAVESAGVDERALGEVRRLVRIYERAAYAPEPVAPGEAAWAVRVATRLEALAG